MWRTISLHVSAVALAVFFPPGIAEAQSAETKGNCSPVIDRTGGNVTVKCGKADVEVEFLIGVLKQECETFSEQLERWGKDIEEWRGQIRIALFPRFSNTIVADIRDNKATIYEYDKADFIKIYRTAVDIDNLYNIAYSYRDEIARMDIYISSPEMKYLRSVATVCAWAGVVIDVETWRKTYIRS
ncbi:hypothetical protein J5N58_08350 [Rhizobium cremeum]|uniref:hypothetical protein n=1 Tax=Rhizobium cremeum TaxID=2813827 RepID=UPI001FD2188F|nr:hypothetical protein [Rhizobium cremeum]MCJ7995930.1 hypothetical protein [Rhizobium cremeum]MCJ7999685.1 hypothetical protein [Rhizobium cremeum]